MAIANLQRCLERLYAVDAGHAVEDFLIPDSAATQSIEGATTARALPEKLLFRETPDGLDIGLYLDSQILDRLARDDPTQKLHSGNLADFLTALEGVSHFLCVVWNANNDRRFSLLELELQAEIDKFVLTAVLLARHAHGRVPVELEGWLFDRERIDPELDNEIGERYLQANEYARYYCRWLQKQFLSATRRIGLMTELRQFYRLGHAGKLARIRREIRH